MCVDTASPLESDNSDKEQAEKSSRQLIRRHGPLSSLNTPSGLISEPQQVVAEASGEFLPAEGGKLRLPQHGVELYIPPGAIPDDGDGTKQEIYIRVTLTFFNFNDQCYCV